MRPVAWSIEAQRDNLEILRYIAEVCGGGGEKARERERGEGRSVHDEALNG